MLQADYDRILTNFNAEMHKKFFFFLISQKLMSINIEEW